MPELSRFYGIVIRMFHKEHQPAHFHAIYAEHESAWKRAEELKSIGKIAPLP